MLTIIRRLLTTSSSCQVNKLRKTIPRKLEYKNDGLSNIPKTDPGIKRRLKSMKNENVYFGDDPDFEGLDDSEADFSNIDRAHVDYEHETEAEKELLQLQIVKKKYFDVQFPNFLTWSEKEHIRFLNSTDPEEWCPEKIAETFPTTVDGAKNLIKATWKPASESRILRHDSSALRNWKELKEGTLPNISPKVKEHILKFSNRTIPPRRTEPLQSNILKLNPKSNEFSSIITKFETTTESKYTGKVDNDSKQLLMKNNEESIEKLGDEMIVKTNASHSKGSSIHVTLEELRKNISRKSKENVSPLDKVIISAGENMIENKIVDNTYENASLMDNKEFQIEKKIPKPTESVSQNEVTDKDVLQSLKYLKRIRIPKKSFKRGVTYKVNDCFYDDDGRFLYRVPGLVND